MISRIDGVLCCGNISYDIPVWPVTSVAWGKSVWVDEITFSVGGNGANTSYSMATLGAPVRLTGMVGRDARGMTRSLRCWRRRVCNRDISRTDPPTTCDGGSGASRQRSILHSPSRRQPRGYAMHAYVRVFRASRISIWQIHFPCRLIRTAVGDVMARARAAGLTTSLDTAWDAKDRWMEDIGPGLPYTDLCSSMTAKPRCSPAVTILRIATRMFRELRREDVVVKMGPTGMPRVRRATKNFEVPGFSVTAKIRPERETALSAGFLASLHRGLDLREAARFANAVGAMNVEKLGAAQGVRSWEETQAWIRERDTL